MSHGKQMENLLKTVEKNKVHTCVLKNVAHNDIDYIFSYKKMKFSFADKIANTPFYSVDEM